MKSVINKSIIFLTILIGIIYIFYFHFLWQSSSIISKILKIDNYTQILFLICIALFFFIIIYIFLKLKITIKKYFQISLSIILFLSVLLILFTLLSYFNIIQKYLLLQHILRLLYLLGRIIAIIIFISFLYLLGHNLIPDIQENILKILIGIIILSIILSFLIFVNFYNSYFIFLLIFLTYIISYLRFNNSLKLNPLFYQPIRICINNKLIGVIFLLAIFYYIIIIWFSFFPYLDDDLMVYRLYIPFKMSIDKNFVFNQNIDYVTIRLPQNLINSFLILFYDINIITLFYSVLYLFYLRIIYKIIKLLFDKNIAVLTIIISMFLNIFIYSILEINDTLITELFGITGVFFWIKYYKNKINIDKIYFKEFIKYIPILLCSFSFITKYWGITFLILILFLDYRKKRFKSIFISLVVIFLAFLPSILFYKKTPFYTFFINFFQINKSQNFFLRQFDYTFFRFLKYRFFALFDRALFNQIFEFGCSYIYSGISISLGIIFFLYFFKKKQKISLYLFYFYIIFFFFISKVRYFLVIIPISNIIMVYSLKDIIDKNFTKKWQQPIIYIIIFIFIFLSLMVTPNLNDVFDIPPITNSELKNHIINLEESDTRNNICIAYLINSLNVKNKKTYILAPRPLLYAKYPVFGSEFGRYPYYNILLKKDIIDFVFRGMNNSIRIVNSRKLINFLRKENFHYFIYNNKNSILSFNDFIICLDNDTYWKQNTKIIYRDKYFIVFEIKNNI